MISNIQYALDGAWKVLLAGVILGAGLPLLFALGIRSLAWGAGGGAEVATTSGGAPVAGNPIGRPLGVLCFVLVIAFVAVGITIIIAQGFGKTVSFAHVFPTFTDS